MEKNFDKSKSGDIGLTQVRTDAIQIDKFLTDTPLGGNVSDQWNRVKSELDSISKAYGIASLAQISVK
jgi:hypothetical protein